MKLSHAPCEIAHHYLVAAGLITMPEQQKEWPGYARRRPDKPDRLVAVADTDMLVDAPILGTGELIGGWGIQVAVRGLPDGYNEAFAMAHDILAELEISPRRTVQFPTARYLVQQLSPTTGPLYIGDEDNTRRPIFTINGLLYVSEA